MSSYNFYSKLLNLKHPITGLSLMVTYTLELVCERCKKKMKPEKCDHNLKYIPPWKSKEKLEINKILLKDLPHILQRESL